VVPEQQVGDKWLPGSPSIVCFWEGFATPVAPGEQYDFPFIADSPGIWRVRTTMALGCDPDQPLSHDNCAFVTTLVSNEFQVIAKPTNCVVTGCSSHVCFEQHVATTCEYRAHYACFRDANCGNFGPGGECEWEGTPELLDCLDRNGAGAPAPALPAQPFPEAF
jgi:hypothetical protein